ncbi:replication associated protein [Vochisia rufa associated gemykibivirus]|nr:replication associated protein [Vochisia rufa associated gemykibivirus]
MSLPAIRDTPGSYLSRLTAEALHRYRGNAPSDNGPGISDWESHVKEHMEIIRAIDRLEEQDEEMRESGKRHKLHQPYHANIYTDSEPEQQHNTPEQLRDCVEPVQTDFSPKVTQEGAKTRRNQFRFRARYGLFTWAQIDPEIITVEMIKNKVLAVGAGKMRIGLERHQDGGWHYHCFAEASKKIIQFRKTSALDFVTSDGVTYHPNFKKVVKNYGAVYDYVAKENLVFSNMPDVPRGKVSGVKTKADEVFHEALQQDTKDGMLRIIKEGAPARYCTSYTQIKCAADANFPQRNIKAIADPDCDLLLDGYDSVRDWIRRYIPERDIGGTKLTGELPPNGIDTDSTASTSTSSTSGWSAINGTEDSSLEEWMDLELAREELSCGVTSIAPSTRYDINVHDVPQEANTPQGRPKSLILWGPTGMGKSILARSLGKYCNMAGRMNLQHFDNDCDYMILDDLPKGFRDFPHYKLWFQGAPQVNCSDKYMSAKSITWGRPCIWLSNQDPKTDRSVEYEWLQGNCVIVHVNTPIVRVKG